MAAKKKAARMRAARERQERIEQAIARLPALQQKQQKLEKKKSQKEKQKLKEPRASTTDAEATVPVEDLEVSDIGPAVVAREALLLGQQLHLDEPDRGLIAEAREPCPVHAQRALDRQAAQARLGGLDGEPRA